MPGVFIYPMSATQFDLVYNTFAITFCCMSASTVYFWIRLPSVYEAFKSAVVLAGLVTFVAAYHYWHLMGMWAAAYRFPPADDGMVRNPVLSGQPYRDSYRYMDWAQTVPLILVSIVHCLRLSAEDMKKNSFRLAASSFFMVFLGYQGEVIIDDDLDIRWMWWAMAMIFFIYILYMLLVTFKGAITWEPNPEVRRLLYQACYLTCGSWLTYPIVYIFPMLGLTGPYAYVAIQLGYSFSDIVSKCGVGFVVYGVCYLKSNAAKTALMPEES